MSHFNVSLIVWAKSPVGIHKPQFLKRKGSRSGSNRGPSAYQPSALPLGHTGSHETPRKPKPQTFETPVWLSTTQASSKPLLSHCLCHRLPKTTRKPPRTRTVQVGYGFTLLTNAASYPLQGAEESPSLTGTYCRERLFCR